MRVKRTTTCRKDSWIGRPDYVVACTPYRSKPWAFDHFHAIVDGTPCDCRHATHWDAREAHGQPVEGYRPDDR